jgi:hypothetical protein
MVSRELRPVILQSRIVGPLYSKANEYRARLLRIIGPTIKYRQEMFTKYGADWADKPVSRDFICRCLCLYSCPVKNDYLTWVMEEESGTMSKDPEYLALRVLQVNFAAIHTSSMVSILRGHATLSDTLTTILDIHSCPLPSRCASRICGCPSERGLYYRQARGRLDESCYEGDEED